MNKRTLKTLLAVFLLAALGAGAQYTSKIVREQGGDKMLVLSGGEVEVQSGGTLDVQSGSTTTLAGTTTISGAVTQTGTFSRTGREVLCGADPKVGATAGWVVAAATNVGRMATVPASQSGSTLVVVCTGIEVGDTITGFRIVGQIESAGGAVTLDAELRKLTAAAADLTDASVGSITQISVTADTKVETSKTGLAEVVAQDERFYILITATTAASTDIDLSGVSLIVTKS